MLVSFIYMIILVIIGVLFNGSGFAQKLKVATAWAIIKISYNPKTQEAVGGITGTAFFLNSTTFVSSYHRLNDDLFKPNKGFSKVKVLLANETGTITEKVKIKQTIPKIDLTIGEVEQKDKYQEYSRLDTSYEVGSFVMNIGNPAESRLVDYDLAIIDSNLKVTRIVVKPVIEYGKILHVGKYTIRSNDVNLQDIDLINLIYSSKIGFSGGSLLLRSNGQVIGMMLLILPKEVDPKQSAMAIPINEILKILSRDIQWNFK